MELFCCAASIGALMRKRRLLRLPLLFPQRLGGALLRLELLLGRLGLPSRRSSGVPCKARSMLSCMHGGCVSGLRWGRTALCSHTSSWLAPFVFPLSRLWVRAGCVAVHVACGISRCNPPRKQIQLSHVLSSGKSHWCNVAASQEPVCMHGFRALPCKMSTLCSKVLPRPWDVLRVFRCEPTVCALASSTTAQSRRLPQGHAFCSHPAWYCLTPKSCARYMLSTLPMNRCRLCCICKCQSRSGRAAGPDWCFSVMSCRQREVNNSS